MEREQDGLHFLLNDVTERGEESQPMDEKLKIINDVRLSSPDAQSMVDYFFLTTNRRLRNSLLAAQKEIEDFRGHLERLTAPPLFSAIFIRYDADNRSAAVVHFGTSRRVVNIDSRIQENSLFPGDEVYLGPQLNAIIKGPHNSCLKSGETGYFESAISGDRLIIRSRDEKIIVDSAEALRNVGLKPGDMIHLDRTAQMAFEKIDDTEKNKLFIGDVPDVRREDVGGQDENLEELYDLVVGQIEDPEGASEYNLLGSSCIMLVGPPGTGKTLMAQFLASTVFRLTGKKGSFVVVKPGEWESPWVGETQANIRNTFKRLRETAEAGPVILFMDEIEAIGRSRGGMSSQHSDKFLAALLPELDGFVALGRVIVISASNRKDLIDPALLERLTADGEFHIGRPDIHGARAIFNIHLPDTLPYCANGSSSEETRQKIIETAVSRIFSPNGTGSHVCELRFRDGKSRVIEARELISGRLIKQMCTMAKREAYRRKNKGGETGVSVLDMERALSRTVERLRRKTLTPMNAREHIHDLPQDIDIVSVEPVAERGVKNEKRYLVLDVA